MTHNSPSEYAKVAGDNPVGTVRDSLDARWPPKTSDVLKCLFEDVEEMKEVVKNTLDTFTFEDYKGLSGSGFSATSSALKL